MSTFTGTVVLITGPNRGIGRELLERFVSRPNHLVIGAVRDSEATLSRELLSLQAGEGSKVIIVKIDSAIDSDAQAAITDIQKNHGIDKIDIVIANTGIIEDVTAVAETSPEAMRQHVNVNVIGVVTLFQATAALLQKSPKPKFFALSGFTASLNLMEVFNGPWFLHGVTKAALNYTLRKVHLENWWLTAVALNPGWTQTETGAFLARSVDIDAAPLPLKASIDGLISVIDEASRNAYGGLCIGHDKEPVQW
ncbi:hypothetical protein OPT61_g24 [Boeremia exigua]|uniref:Uncharacterized protein n=1 Tax=Boeremia exigua TaxID=749465 RepID=A0ACC2IVC9_9PLEO|nr:hypothetical protein OPT61_g24 [Boeremia exigua]